MMRQKLSDIIRKMPVERISSAVFYAIVVPVSIVFALFYFVGYGMPYEENPQFSEPLFTDVLLCVIYIVSWLNIAALAASAVLSLRSHRSGNSFSNGIPTSVISCSVTAFVALCLILTFVFGSGEPLHKGGESHVSAFWLITADMFVNTVGILLAAILVLIVFDMSGLCNKIRKGKRNVQE